MSKQYTTILLALLLQTAISFETIDSLYINHATLQNSALMSANTQYNFTVSWPSTISNIRHSALALRGYHIEPEYSYLTYTVSLNSVNSSSAVITFQPLHTGTSTTLMQFEVLVTNSLSSGKIELLTQSLTPSVLSLSQRPNVNQQTFPITSSTFDLTDSTDFYISAFLVDFRVRMAQTQTQEIKVQQISVSGQTIQVVVYSLHTYANSIEAITLSLLIIKKSAFTPSIVYHNSNFDSYCQRCTKNYEVTPDTIKAQSCIVPLDHFRPSSPEFTPQGVTSSFNNNVISFDTLSLSWAVFNISCYLQCGAGSYFQYVNNVSTCQSCPTQCATCLNSSYCMSCNGATFLENNQCNACATGCLTCTSLTACSQCEAIYALVSGTCNDCNSTAGFYFSNNQCLSCHSSCTNCFGQSNNCSSCATGYALDSSTSTCRPPPNTVIDCLHIHHVTLRESNPMTTPNTYTFPVTWSSTINGITTGALALSGFEVQPAFGYLSYHASLTGITSTGANIVITPNKTDTETVVLQFDVLLVTDCASTKINLFSYPYNPTVLSNASRSADSQFVRVPSPVFDLTTSTDYYISIFLEDFIMVVPGINHQRIGVDLSSVQVHEGSIRFVLYSHVDYSNTISQVTFTVLIVRKSGFTHPFFQLNQFYSAGCNDTNCAGSTSLTANSSFTRLLVETVSQAVHTEDCIVPFKNLRTGFVNESLRGVTMTFNNDQIDYAVNQISWAEYNISCYLTCESGYYYSGDQSSGSCIMCPLNCPNCLNQTACCQDGYIYTSSGTCTACSSGQYASSFDTCSSCSEGCSACASSSSCTSCSSDYSLNSGACTRVSSSSQSSSSIAGIVAGVICGIIAILLIIFLIWLFCTQGGKAFRQRCCGAAAEDTAGENQQGIGVTPGGLGTGAALYAAKAPSIKSILVNDECSICLNQHLNSRTACGHYFHYQCIKEWMGQLQTCPVCSTHDVTPVDIYCIDCQSFLQIAWMNKQDEIVIECRCKDKMPPSTDSLEDKTNEVKS